LINKYVFLGDINSINTEIIIKSHKYLKNKVKFILIGNITDLREDLKKLNSNFGINEIFDPYDFTKYKYNKLNIYNVEKISKEKHENLLNQIKISNKLSFTTGIDLITMPINKFLFKKKINFIGMTEYLAHLNKKNTFMLMYGENFSVIPLTTHVNPKRVYNAITKKKIEKKISLLLKELKKNYYRTHFNEIKFLCYNPHCGENGTIGQEDEIIKKAISKYRKIKGMYSADSAFLNYKKNTLFISMYHDQALIPFKILNKNCLNLTIGLNYRRLSPAHGTASDIKFKNKADIKSYLECMNF